jgi:hypothetical protein
MKIENAIHRPRAGATLWPLGVAMAYGTFAAAMIGFTIWSTGQREELVSRDYYAREVAHQTHMDAVARARPLPVRLSLVAGGLSLESPPGLASSATNVEVSLYRPSSAALDRLLPSAFDPTGTRMIPLEPALSPGFWRASVRWNMNGQEYLTETTFHSGS